MDNSLKTKINFEISKIDDLVKKSSPLLEKCKKQEPDFIELNAIGSVLHSYYNGLESIFKLIYKSSEEKPLSGTIWHSELLNYIFSKTDILDQKLFTDLKDYLGFRHVFRHSYSFELNWDRVKSLFLGLNDNWQTVKNCLQINL